MKNVAVIIVNWNGKKHLERCLYSLHLQEYKDFMTIMVDNGSDDDSVSFVEKEYPEVEIIKLEKNTGFAYANNVGISHAFENNDIDFVITLNNDTEVSENYIAELVLCAKKNESVGSVQPKVVNFFDKTIDSTGILIYPDMSARDRGYGESDDGQYDKEEEIFGVSASAALYSKEALEVVKLGSGEYFDSDYFAYSEDVDLAWRIRLSGFRSMYTPNAKVLHIHSATGKSFSSFKAYHLQRNQYFNIIKNLPGSFMWKALLRMPLRYFMMVLSLMRKKGPSAELSKSNEKKESIVKTVIRAWIGVISNLSSLLKKRKIVQQKNIVSKKEIKKWFLLYGADIKKIIYGN